MVSPDRSSRRDSTDSWHQSSPAMQAGLFGHPPVGGRELPLTLPGCKGGPVRRLVGQTTRSPRGGFSHRMRSRASASLQGLPLPPGIPFNLEGDSDSWENEGGGLADPLLRGGRLPVMTVGMGGACWEGRWVSDVRPPDLDRSGERGAMSRFQSEASSKS